MALFHSPRSSSSRSDGKFIKRQISGISKDSSELYNGYELTVSHQRAGQTVQRSIYNITINLQYGKRVEYLRGYASPKSALEAARIWIDEAMIRTKRINSASAATLKIAASLGRIPKQPE